MPVHFFALVRDHTRLLTACIDLLAIHQSDDMQDTSRRCQGRTWNPGNAHLESLHGDLHHAVTDLEPLHAARTFPQSCISCSAGTSIDRHRIVPRKLSKARGCSTGHAEHYQCVCTEQSCPASIIVSEVKSTLKSRFCGGKPQSLAIVGIRRSGSVSLTRGRSVDAHADPRVPSAHNGL